MSCRNGCRRVIFLFKNDRDNTAQAVETLVVTIWVLVTPRVMETMPCSLDVGSLSAGSGSATEAMRFLAIEALLWLE